MGRKIARDNVRIKIPMITVMSGSSVAVNFKTRSSTNVFSAVLPEMSNASRIERRLANPHNRKTSDTRA